MHQDVKYDFTAELTGIGDGSAHEGTHLLLRSPGGYTIIFRWVCLLYINMLHVVTLSFIVLPKLVKHTPVAGVVRRNMKFNVKMLKFPISDTFHALLRRMTL